MSNEVWTAKYSKGLILFFSVCCIGLFLLFAFLLFRSIVPSLWADPESGIRWFLLFFLLGMKALMAYLMADLIVSKVIIDKFQVKSVSLFQTKTLLFKDIKGYRQNDYYFILVPKNKGQKKILISKMFTKSNELVAWLNMYVLNLDVHESALERQEILKNETFGWTEEQRDSKLSNANRIAWILNVFGVGIGLWAFFYPYPFQYIIVCSLVVLLFSIGSVHLSEGLIRIQERENSEYPDISIAVLFPSLGLSLRAFLDINVLDFSNGWIPIVLLILLVFVGLSFGNHEVDRKSAHFRITLFLLLFIAVNFSYGTTVLVNSHFDNSSPQIYKTTVVSKKIEFHKVFLYRLRIAPWGPQKDTTEVKVPLDVYESVGNNDKINVYLKKGNMGIPWYSIGWE